MTIITNNKPRPLLSLADLTKRELYDMSAYTNRDSFFRYKRNVYALADFTTSQFLDASKWDGVFGESYFSGVLIRLDEQNNQVVVGRYYE